jgi:hypothetical protein
MWPLPHIRNELVTITLTPGALSCAWIQRIHNRDSLFSRISPHALGGSPSNPLYKLCAYTHIPFEHLEYVHGTIYNPTHIAQEITRFLHEHHLEHAFVALGVAGEHIIQRLVSCSVATPHKEQFMCPELEKVRFEYRYLYPNNDNTFTFYLCGLSQEQIFQYKLLAIRNHHNLTNIMPLGAAHLQLYKYLAGSAFSPSRLALDLAHAKTLENLISSEQIKKLCTQIPDTMPTEHLSCMLGLFTAGTCI